jgi:hypothetical protein
MAEAVGQDGRHHWATAAARLQRHGVSALDVLVELAACHAFLHTNPRVTLSDTHRDYVTSKAVLGLCPQPRRVTPAAAAKGTNGYSQKLRPAALRHVGPHLVQALAPLLSNTIRSLETDEERARAEVDEMRKPFQPTPTARAAAAAQLTPSK